MSKKLSEKLWWRKLAFAGAAIAMLPLNLLAQDADTGDEELEELEAFTMIGSRISRVDAEPISPVLNYRAADLKSSGYNTVADALRALPMNNGQSLTPSDSGTSFTPGVSTINLRGLGNNYTLALVNGRRMAPFALPGFNGLQSVFDINSVPDAAISAVQIEKDGASALYGSDAVAGVVHYDLIDDYDGASFEITVGNYADTDGFTRDIGAVYGISTTTDSIVFATSYHRTESVYSRDLDYTSNADNTGDDIKNDRWEFDDPDAAAADGVTIADWEAFAGGSPTDAGDWNQLSSYGTPGAVVYGGEFDGKTLERDYYTFDGPTETFSNDNLMSGLHRYNYEKDSILFPSVKRYSIYSHVKHNITDHLYAFGEIIYSRSDTHNESAPTPAALSNEQGLTVGSDMMIPSYNAYNPFGTDLTTGYRRLVETGNRSTDAVAESTRYVAGLGGNLAGDWSWEFGALHSENKVKNHSKVVTDYKLQQALNGLTLNDEGTLVYDESTPTSERVYFNWFGENGDKMVDFLRDFNDKSGTYTLESVDFNIGGTIFELPAGNVGFNIGTEYREESIDIRQSYLNENAMIVGGSEGTSFNGGRNITSIFAETVIPAFTWLDLQFAGRYEKYSDDGFDNTIRPKVGFKLKPLSWLAIRGSYGKSFKAPDLAYLYMSSSTSFTNGPIPDPLTGDKNQLKVITAGNPDLGPEKADTYYLGFILSPTEGIFKNFTFSVDYVRFEIEDVLMQLSDVYGYTDFLNGAIDGDPKFVNQVVRDSNNHIVYLLDDYQNLGEETYDAYDFELTYSLDTEKYGSFYSSLKASYIHSFEIDGDQLVGDSTTPKWRASYDLGWSKGDWSADLYVNYIGGRSDLLGYSYTLSNYPGFTSDQVVNSVYDIDDQFVVNPSVSYSGFWNSRITLGINNLLNDEPPSDPKQGLGYLAGVNYGKPLYYYLKFSKQF